MRGVERNGGKETPKVKKLKGVLADPVVSFLYETGVASSSKFIEGLRTDNMDESKIHGSRTAAAAYLLGESTPIDRKGQVRKNPSSKEKDDAIKLWRNNFATEARRRGEIGILENLLLRTATADKIKYTYKGATVFDHTDVAQQMYGLKGAKETIQTNPQSKNHD